MIAQQEPVQKQEPIQESEPEIQEPEPEIQEPEPEIQEPEQVSVQEPVQEPSDTPTPACSIPAVSELPSEPEKAEHITQETPEELPSEVSQEPAPLIPETTECPEQEMRTEPVLEAQAPVESHGEMVITH